MTKKGLSIIIITFNRKHELLFTLDKLKKLKTKYNYEIIVIDQNSSDGTEEYFKNDRLDINYTKCEKNLGVAGGRNKGAQLAKYEYLIFIDDDAHFVDDNALDIIYDWMKKNEDTDIFAFQIRDKISNLYNWPYPKTHLKKVNDKFFANKFIGCGHAIKKTFFELADGYSEDLFFWGEETELVLKSFSLNNRPVLYNGEIVITHRVTPIGRYKDGGRFFYQVRNRLYIIKNMYPVSFNLSFVYYKVGYFLKALKNNWVLDYKRALKEFKKMEIRKKYVISTKRLINYYLIYHKNHVLFNNSNKISVEKNGEKND